MAETLHTGPEDSLEQRSADSQTGRFVRDIMTTPVHTVDMDESLLTVKRLFERERCHHVVIKRHRRAFGVVSDRDILRALSPFVGSKTMERAQDINTLKKRVHQIMSRDLVTIKPDDTISATAEKMLQEDVSCLPVVDDSGSVVGIVTVRDFVRWSLDLASSQRRHPGKLDEEDGIVVVVDGNQCYSPNSEIAGLIREAVCLYDADHGARFARAKRLPVTPDTANIT